MRVIIESGDKPEMRSVIYGLQKCGLEFVIVDEVDCSAEETSSDVGNQLLTNDIFNDELFNTNARLVALRDTIVSGVTGKDCLDLTSGHEWFWLYAAIYDSGVLETRKNRDNVVTDAGFVRQMTKFDIRDRHRVTLWRTNLGNTPPQCQSRRHRGGVPYYI